MFQALVLACLATNPNICQTLEDLYGPYETKKECTTRAYEIAVELPEYLPNFVAMKYKCVDVADKRKIRVYNERVYHKRGAQATN